MSEEGSSPRMTLRWNPMNDPAMPTSAAVISLGVGCAQTGEPSAGIAVEE
jgi:hypothetical protein